jgi:ADP-dependent NAD(P)H-hydrate dehydratase / NAD(P)H-hydrate epimerase
MKVTTALEMQEIDRITIGERGIPGEVLMGMAGKAVADHIMCGFPRVERVAIFSGTGNNGGDGFVAAYYLANGGTVADVFLIGSEDKISETSRIYHTLCRNSGIRITTISSAGDLADLDLESYDCVVDAILGTGFTGAAKGLAAEAIRIINDCDVYVVSVDVPSGLGSDGQAPEGEAVIADSTVTIGLPKLSLVTYPGKEYTGELHVADIGFPRSLVESDSLKNELIDQEYFTKNLIREIESEHCTRADTHKGARGHLLIIGGFDGMEGAALMVARAALETGAGLATLLTTSCARSVIAGKIPELITLSFPEDIDSSSHRSNVVKKELDAVIEAKKYDVLVIGPGMGRSRFAYEVFESVIAAISRLGIRRVLIDGDGLFHLSEYIVKGSLDRQVEWLVTPHFKEASRLMGISIDEIKNNRLRSAGGLAQRLSCVSLLKGPATIVSNGERYYINTTGSAALATAGSGDVLSGIIGSLMLRRFTMLQAASCGAWIHGKAADLYCSDNKYDVLKSTDMLAYIRKAKNCI